MYKFKYKSLGNNYSIILCYYDCNGVLSHVYNTDDTISIMLRFTLEEYRNILKEFGGIHQFGYCRDIIFFDKKLLYQCMLYLNKNYECYIQLIN